MDIDGPEILTNRTGVVLAAVFSTTDTFSAYVTRAAEKVREALHLQAEYDSMKSHGSFRLQMQLARASIEINDLKDCKSVLEELINQYNPKYHYNVLYSTFTECHHLCLPRLMLHFRSSIARMATRLNCSTIASTALTGTTTPL